MMDGIKARRIVNRACRQDPELRTAIDYLLAQARDIGQEVYHVAKEAHVREATAAAAGARWADGNPVPGIVEQAAREARAARTRPFPSARAAAQVIQTEVNSELDRQGIKTRGLETIRRHIPADLIEKS